MCGLTGRVFARLDARLNHIGPEPVALALSGGGDSVAVLEMAAAWAKSRGRHLLALTVDHNLNPDSAAWTRFASEAARAAGADWRGMIWQDARGGPGVPARAREARHILLANAARSAGARVILTGHTADDIAEGDHMRAEGTTLGHLHDWSPSPAWPQGEGLMLMRPVLNEARAALRDHLRERGLSWLDDPANEDLRYGRGRARAAIRALAETVGRTGNTNDRPCGYRLSNHGDDAHGGGLSKPDLAWAGVFAITRDVPASALAATLLCAGGGTTPPRGHRLSALKARLLQGDDFTAVLCGARVEAIGACVNVMREAGEWKRHPVMSVALPAARAEVWDGRFLVTTDESDLRIKGAAGLLAQLSDEDRAVLGRWPAAARVTAPVLVKGGARPVLAWRRAAVRALGVRRMALFMAATGDETTQEDELFETLHGETPPSDLF